MVVILILEVIDGPNTGNWIMYRINKIPMVKAAPENNVAKIPFLKERREKPMLIPKRPVVDGKIKNSLGWISEINKKAAM
jgi:hypothetical protein